MQKKLAENLKKALTRYISCDIIHSVKGRYKNNPGQKEVTTMKNVKMTIYENYGLLAHEKQTVYTLAQATNICDTVRVIIPNVSGANVVDEPILNLDGQDYLLSEVLTSVNDKPALRWVANGSHHTRMLTIIGD